MTGNPPSTVKSAMRTLDIIEYVVARPTGVVAQDISAGLAIPVSSLSYLLATLVDRAYLRRDGRRYLPGPGLERLLTPRAELSLTERVAPLVKSLRLQLNETASFFVRIGWELEAIVTETAEQSLRYSISVGTRTPMHCLAAGKAMLATLGDEELDVYFKQAERASFTSHSLRDEARLRAELDTIRASGIAYTREEYTLGICGIGKAALMDGQAIGAFAVAVPIARFDRDIERRSIELLEDVTASFAAAETGRR